MKTEIFETYEEFLNREDKDVNGVSPEFAERNPDYIEQNNTNKGCYDCSDCYDCYRCSRCYDCYRCSGCSRCYGIKDDKEEGSTEGDMYGLFRYTYDHYEWEDLVAVSDSREKLKDHYRSLDIGYPLVSENRHEVYRDNEDFHYVIKRVLVV